MPKDHKTTTKETSLI